MKLAQMLVRHYKSFNYDYERKAKPNATPRKWEVDKAGWFPFVEVPLESDVTAIVGANESGKSHLLDAIQVLLTGKDYEIRDFCRYSTLLSVEEGQRRFPDFSGVFNTSQAERQLLTESGIPLQANGMLQLWCSNPTDWKAINKSGNALILNEDAKKAARALMPIPFRLMTNIPLPDSVSIRQLAGEEQVPGRRQRHTLMQLLSGIRSAEALQGVSESVLAELTMTPVGTTDSIREKQQELGRLLLTKIARVDGSTFVELEKAIAQEQEGHVNGLIQKMNESLARHLNLSRWWRQDSDFTLRVSPREHELVFTIRDRTGTDYSFNERSTGLRYFLSYFVQLRAHESDSSQSEVLLMDEPDTYLSASGQQDLLRVLENYIGIDGQESNRQVIHVTHSPFLINRNAGHRIRVLDKGTAQEGTRVVTDATRNRYEPLRSSIGTFVAETAFIGGANLFVEGTADQIYIAEMSNYLRLRGTPESQLIDLNEVTIVVSGSASSIPYMLYLARGQDEVKPPCAVLLDSDEAGLKANLQIAKGGAYGKSLIPSKYVVILGDWAIETIPKVAADVIVRDIEDLIPLRVAVAAARSYAVHFLGYSPVEAARLKESDVANQIASKLGSLFDALSLAFSHRFETSIEKVGFAKEVIRFVNSTPQGGRRPDGVPDLETNFGALINHLSELMRQVVSNEADKRRSKRLRRIVKGFLRDYPDSATRDRANVALREIEAASDESEQGESIRAVVAGIRREFRLSAEPLSAVDDYAEFNERFSNLIYVERLANQGQLMGPETIDD